MLEPPVGNVDYAAWNTKDAVDWMYAIRTESQSTAGLYDETKEKLETLFSLFDSFIVSKEVEYWIDSVPEDLSPKEAVERKDTTKRVLRSDAVAFADLVSDLESITMPSDHVPYLSKLDVKRAKTQLFLRDGDVCVDETTPEYYKMWLWGNVVSEDAPDYPAVEVSMGHGSRRLVDSHYSKSNGETAFDIRVGSYCFIWFEDTPIGRVNRKRLGSFLRDICHRFDCVDARFTSDMARYSQIDVTRVVSETLPEEASLIADAREYFEEL